MSGPETATRPVKSFYLRSVRIGAVASGLLVVALLTITRTEAAFSGTTQNQTNTFDAAASFAINLHLHNNPTPPTGNTTSQDLLPLDATEPTATTLRNYDTDRDAAEGLLLAKGSGLGETDLVKFQRWRHTPSSSLTLSGTAQLTIYTAMKDFTAGKSGAVDVGLYDCTTGGSSCTQLASGSASQNPWPNTWQAVTVDLGAVSHTVASGRALIIKVVVSDSSGDDLLFAYDTTAYASELEIS
ncbi:MAG: hypothetical protein AAGA90_20130 [Actinomycetota bacterium]